MVEDDVGNVGLRTRVEGLTLPRMRLSLLSPVASVSKPIIAANSVAHGIGGIYE